MSQQLLRRAWNFIDTIKQVYPEDWSPEEQVLLDDLMKADLDQSPDYERGFIDGMQKQAQSSVDKAVNAMSRQAEKQEPVAWGMPGADGFIFDVICPEEHARLEGGYTVPLYTTPQLQREWVGLTEEDINEVLGSDIHDEPSGLLDFVRAIEAKLRSKNT